MAASFYPAPDVERIGRQLIREHHEHLLTHDCRVEFIFRSDIPKKNGDQVWGTARKITSLAAYLANPDAEDADTEETNAPFFVITISHPVWLFINDMQKVALVDHELCHCWAGVDKKGNVQLKIVNHDLEEFRCIYQRYGYWHDGIEEFVNISPNHQQALPLESEAA